MAHHAFSIGQRKPSIFKFQKRNVRLFADLNRAQSIIDSHGLCGVDFDGSNDVFHGHAEEQELAHRGGQINDGAKQIEVMQVGTDRIGPEAKPLTSGLRNSPHGITKGNHEKGTFSMLFGTAVL